MQGQTKNAIEELKARFEAQSSGTTIPLHVDPNLIKNIAANGLTTKIFEFLYLICGQKPMINNIGYHERGSEDIAPWQGMMESHALFRGVKRPLDKDGEDSNIYIYVMNPSYTYKFIPNMVCTAKRVQAPSKAVFVVYVKYSEDRTKGEVLNWEWVKAADDKLPNNADERYDEEMWK